MSQPRSIHWLILVIVGLAVACAQPGAPKTASSAVPEQWAALTRTNFSVSLPPGWGVIDPRSPSFEADYALLVAEHPGFGEAYPRDFFGFKWVSSADAIAFDFTMGRSEPTAFTLLMVTSESLADEERLRSTRNFIYETAGATNVTTTYTRVGNAAGRRVSLEYPRHLYANVPRGPAPVSEGQWLREVSFHAYPASGGVIVLAFTSPVELADAYGTEFESIAGSLLAR